MMSQGRSQFRGSPLRTKQKSPALAKVIARPRLISVNMNDRTRAIDSFDDALSSSLLTRDKVLAGVLHEVEEISKSLKSATPDTLALSKTLEKAVLGALKQSILNNELRSLALTDDLTCLYNRRAFLASATQQLKVARRKGQRLLLFFADVDNLKDINDSYRHHEGDLALIRTAYALEETFRDSDILARLGGDEFAVLALEASSPNQEVILHRLEQNLRRSSADESRYPLTLSVGVARFDPKYSFSLGDLLSQADHAMYEKKRTQPRFFAHRT